MVAHAARSMWTQLNPQTPDCKIMMADNDPLVERTPFLGWLPATATAAGQARVALSHFEMIKWFLPRNSFPRGGAVETAALRVTPLDFRLPIPFWLRTLNELTASGLEDALDSGATTDAHGFVEVLRALTIANPHQLQFTAGDLTTIGESFDAPGVAAARGRGRGAVATPATPGPPGLRYLSLCSVLEFEAPKETCPLACLCELVGMLGASLTRASRDNERSAVRVVGGLLRSNLVAGYGEGDGLIAGSLPDYLRSLRLPYLFSAPTSSHATLLAEARDTILYHRNLAGRQAVENGRLPHVRARRVPPPPAARTCGASPHACSADQGSCPHTSWKVLRCSLLGLPSIHQPAAVRSPVGGTRACGH